MAIELHQRQILRSVLYQYGSYDYPLAEGWQVYLNVSEGSDSNGYYWARWRLEHKVSDGEIFERGRRRRFRKRDDAVNWLCTEYDAPWRDMVQQIHTSSPVPCPR